VLNNQKGFIQDILINTKLLRSNIDIEESLKSKFNFTKQVTLIKTSN